MIKVLITGGRSFRDRDMMCYAIVNFLRIYKDPFFIHGDCIGADQLAGDLLFSQGYPVAKMPANWVTYGKSAGMRRNKEMYDFIQPDVVLAFPGGNGTRAMKDYAASKGCKIVEAVELANER